MKKNIVFMLSIFMFLACFSIKSSYAIEKSQTEQIYEECYRNLDTVQITKEEIDVTKDEINIFKRLYETSSYKDINQYFLENNLAISVITNNSTRAMEGKIFTKVYPQKGTQTINLALGGKKTFNIEWNLIVRCNYSINVQTEMISSLSNPTLSLESNTVFGDTQNLQIIAHRTKATKINGDTWIKLDISYSISTKHYYFPFESITFGPYSIVDTIK